MSYSKDIKSHTLIHMKGYIQYVCLNTTNSFWFYAKFVHKYNGSSGTTKLNGHNTAECDYVLRCPDFQNVWLWLV